MTDDFERSREPHILTDQFPFLLPDRIGEGLSERLRSLADDLDRIRDGSAPTWRDLERAPAIRNWRPALGTTGLRLVGIVENHPRIRPGWGITSELWAADPAGIWIRTLSRFYSLGPRACTRRVKSADDRGPQDV